MRHPKPSSHDYCHLPKLQKDRYDALSRLDQAGLDRLKSRATETIARCQTELKIIRLVGRDRKAGEG